MIAVAVYTDAETGEVLARHSHNLARHESGVSALPVDPQTFVCRACQFEFVACPPTECVNCGNIYVNPQAARARR